MCEGCCGLSINLAIRLYSSKNAQFLVDLFLINRAWPVILHRNRFIITARQRSCRKVIFSVMSVCHAVHWLGDSMCTGTFLALAPLYRDPSQPWLSPLCTGNLPLDMFKLVQPGLHCRHVQCSSLLMMKHLWWASGHLASYWNAFFFVVGQWLNISHEKSDYWPECLTDIQLSHSKYANTTFHWFQWK